MDTACELSDSEWASWRAFALVSRRLASTVESRLQRESGISNADFEILQALFHAPDLQTRARDLADMLSWEKSRISHQVTRMVTRGLVDRAECSEDLRGSWVRLTPAGQDALVQALPHYSAAVRELYLTHMGEEGAADFARTALKIVESMSPSGCQAKIADLERTVNGTA